MGKRLKITATRDGFRRAGRAWPAAGTIVDDLDAKQIKAVENEPQLVVVELPPEKAGGDTSKATNGGAKKGGKSAGS